MQKSKPLKIGIISDTHCIDDPRIAQHFAGVDELWHAGDIGDVDTYRRLESISPVFRAVCGNIDGAMLRRVCPEWLVFNTGGLKVAMTHIGGYPGRYATGVKTVLDTERPDIFVAGHSHILRVMTDSARNLLYINPGAAGTHGWQKVRTLIRLTIDGGKPTGLEVIELGKKLLT